MSDIKTDEESLSNLRALFSLLGRAHMLELFYEILIAGDPPVRFNELQEPLDLSPNTLSRRLDELETAGFLLRRSYDEIPPRVEYEPTERLHALEPMFTELSQWLEEYGDDETFTLPDE